MGIDRPAFPPAIHYELAGWELYWARLELTAAPDGLPAVRAEAADRIGALLGDGSLPDHPTAAAVRRLFRAAGCDPTRHRPSSEALVRRLLKGEPLPAILPAVDINNIWSVELLVPCCVVDPRRIAGPLTLRAGRPGESMLSMRGPFHLAGKPLLADLEGPFGTPITDGERVKVTDPLGESWLLAYLPAGVVSAGAARARLAEIAARSGDGIQIDTP